MLNVFKYFEKPTELNKSELIPEMQWADKLHDGKVTPFDKQSLNPILYLIKKSPRLAYYYARKIIEGRWSEGEPIILKSPYWSYEYACNIINKGHVNNMVRWEEAEPIIMNDPEAACLYASMILNSRWPEAEPIIMKDPNEASNYAEYVIHDRWPEAEPYIKQDTYHWKEYQNFLKSIEEDDEYQ